jgi:hypothetical protein
MLTAAPQFLVSYPYYREFSIGCVTVAEEEVVLDTFFPAIEV